MHDLQTETERERRELTRGRANNGRLGTYTNEGTQ